jgi:N utilization substance protein B
MHRIVSRRVVRNKTMQALYACRENDTLNDKTIEANLHRSIKQGYVLYLYLLHTATQVALYAIDDKQRRLGKHIRTQSDQDFSVRIAENPFVQHLATDEAFNNLLKREKIAAYTPPELIQKLFNDLLGKKGYKTYIGIENPSLHDHKAAIITIFDHVLFTSELFEAHLEEAFSGYEDDMEYAAETVGITIQSFAPDNMEPCVVFVPQDDWQEKLDFASQLLREYRKHDDELYNLVTPHLERWEPERVAAMDMLLIKMAICEMLYCPHIPVKVSINEYLDIAKCYSTPRSKDFVNGILDKILYQLRREDRIKKAGRGLMDN